MTAAMAERRQATCTPVRWTALIAAPPVEKSAAAPSTWSRGTSPVPFAVSSLTL